VTRRALASAAPIAPAPVEMEGVAAAVVEVAEPRPAVTAA
jgi:hypothetical protein